MYRYSVFLQCKTKKMVNFIKPKIKEYQNFSGIGKNNIINLEKCTSVETKTPLRGRGGSYYYVIVFKGCDELWGFDDETDFIEHLDLVLNA